MLAAIEAAKGGANVVLLEKNNRLGVKLLITGKGRCNITNYEIDNRKLAEAYGDNGKFLLSGLSRFSVFDVIDLFEKQGVKIKVERGNRVFPCSDKSMDVLQVLEKKLRQSGTGVKVVKNAEVNKFVVKGDSIEKVILNNGHEQQFDEYIVCAGGKSYPTTGSDGSMYELLKKLGHTIVPPRPALVPVICKERFIGDLEGLSLKHVEISAWQNDKKQTSRFGEAIFTGDGMSGPIIIDMSKEVCELLSNGQVKLGIDFKPALSEREVDVRILRDFQELKNKMFKNSLDKLLPKKLIPIVIKLSEIDPDKKINSITKEERKGLIKIIKNFELTVTRLAGFDKAIVTSGGVDLKEVDPKTMRSKIIKNLLFAGEVLDIDGPTGGYNLQVAWTTGYVAGSMLDE